MVQRPRPDLRGGCAAMRIPTVTAGGGGALGNQRSYRVRYEDESAGIRFSRYREIPQKQSVIR